MEHPKIVHDGITFDDVLLIPARSDFIPADADTHTKLTRGIELNIPLISAPMDTVTEAALAIALAQEGGIGIIHKNLSVENQAREVEKVKRSENGVIVDPITLPPTATIGTARKVMREYNVSGIPIVEGGDEVIPCEEHVEAFIQWVHERDLYQVPDTATDFMRDQEKLNGDTAVSPVDDDLTLLPRKMVLQLRANANVSLGSGYRAYPGFSVAQVRKQLGLGW